MTLLLYWVRRMPKRFLFLMKPQEYLLRCSVTSSGVLKAGPDRFKNSMWYIQPYFTANEIWNWIPFKTYRYISGKTSYLPALRYVTLDQGSDVPKTLFQCPTVANRNAQFYGWRFIIVYRLRRDMLRFDEVDIIKARFVVSTYLINLICLLVLRDWKPFQCSSTHSHKAFFTSFGCGCCIDHSDSSFTSFLVLNHYVNPILLQFRWLNWNILASCALLVHCSPEYPPVWRRQTTKTGYHLDFCPSGHSWLWIP
jgi:hypothetical protein